MKPAYKTICVIGLGYVGLPTAAIIASRGVRVHGVDVNERAIDLINQGRVHIVEPGLDVLVSGAVAAGMLSAENSPRSADAFIIAVPTPFAEGNKPDLSYLRDAVETLAPVVKAGDLVILESTSPVGTTEQISEWLGGLRPDLAFPHAAGAGADVQIAHSPERVLPGKVLLELVENDRVIGGVSRKCAERASELYRQFVNGECRLTDARTAELVKLAENSYRDVNIAFANELSLVCDRHGINVWEAIELANRHPRVNILKPGPGVGGHCIAVDPWFIIDSAREQTPLMQAARRVNDGKPEHVVDLVKDAAKDFAAPCVACLGLSYKADIDDLRESPAVEIARKIAGLEGFETVVVEPHVETLPDELDGLSPRSLDEALEAANIVLLLADHRAFRALDRNRLAGKRVIDTRGIWA